MSKRTNSIMDPKEPRTQSIYNPNYFAGMKKVVSDGYSFEGYSVRKPLYKTLKPQTIDISSLENITNDKLKDRT